MTNKTTKDNNNILMPYFNIYGADFLAFQNKISKDEWWDICIALSDECIFGATNFIAKNDFQKMLYDKIKLQKNKSYIAYKSKIENGKLGGRPKKNENRNETETKPIDNLSVNRNETETKPKEENRIEDKIKEDNNVYKKNNIKKENVFVEPTVDILSTVDFTENQQNDITILEANTNEVVIERNKQYSQNDLITDEHMVLDCFVEAGISVFNDGQFGFGSLINKIADLWTKEDILGELKLKDIGFRNEIKQCCIENNITNQQLVNYFLNKFGKKQITGFRYFFYDSNNNKINWILDELSKINQLTYSKNGNTIQRSTNISGSNQQEESASTERYITAGTTTSYGTGKEALQRYLTDNVAGYKR